MYTHTTITQKVMTSILLYCETLEEDIGIEVEIELFQQ